MAIKAILADPMLRMLAVATGLAALFPASGDAREWTQLLASIAIFVLFLFNGIRTARREVIAGLMNWRYLSPLTFWVFGVMALVGSGLSIVAEGLMPSTVALGFLFLGVLPSTVQSATSYTSLARGSVALSVISAALLNIAGIFASVPIFVFLGGGAGGEIGSNAVIKIFAILVLPFVIGQLMQVRFAASIELYKNRIVWIDRFIIAMAVYVAFSGAVEQGIWTRLDPASWGSVLGLVGAFLLIGHWGAWLASDVMGLSPGDRVAFLFAGAQKSVAVGAPLAAILFPPSTAGFVIVPLLLYHFFQLVLAAPLASRLALLSRSDAAG